MPAKPRLVADFLEYLFGYWVPRTRCRFKIIRNESTKGSDIIGFRIVGDGSIPLQDTLAIYEAKSQFSGKKAKARLQDAVDGSAKDITRKAESLNAIKQRLGYMNKFEDAEKIERFQNEVDHPYNLNSPVPVRRNGESTLGRAISVPILAML